MDGSVDCPSSENDICLSPPRVASASPDERSSKPYRWKSCMCCVVPVALWWEAAGSWEVVAQPPMAKRPRQRVRWKGIVIGIRGGFPTRPRLRLKSRNSLYRNDFQSFAAGSGIFRRHASYRTSSASCLRGQAGDDNRAARRHFSPGPRRFHLHAWSNSGWLLCCCARVM